MSSAPDQKSSGPLEIEHDEKSVKGEAAVSGDYSGSAEKTDPVEIALVRELDRRIMPILWAMYFLNYKLDRNALPQARLNTLEEDLGLKGVEYNTAISILFERGSTWDGLKQACKDPKTWLFCLMQNLHIAACSFNNFFHTVVRSMGFRSTTALLLTAPPYFVSGILGIPFAWSSGRLNERTWHMTAGLGLAIVGFAMSCGTTNNAVRYASTFLYATGAYSTPENKAVAYSLVNVTANLAYIYCANLWPSTDGLRYMMRT
ncbi:putative transporter [Colletotrichum sidae]|uniref:Putative transporter n=1 Tax=Colletotrichum sidae TaxID=1347389 RepID=A0A4R8TUL1_9PEZI|nr:putative transporter [Colletotrichum sidae]